ncbi:MAG: hypothetical protein WA769_22640 [Pseudolabrys sp.]
MTFTASGWHREPGLCLVGAVAIGKGIGLNLIVGLAPVAAGIWIATT